MSTVSTRRSSRDIAAKPAKSGINTRRGLRDITNMTTEPNPADGKGKPLRKTTRSMTKKPKIVSQRTETRNAAPESMEISPVSAETVNPELQTERALLGMGIDNMEIESPKSISQHDYVDIDKDDLHDADSEARYISDIHENLRERQCNWAVDPTYFQDQPVINERMREILVDWLMDVHLKFRCVTETLFLAISLMDRYLESQATERNQLQLVGVTAFMVATKYEEMHPPEIADLVFITDRTYTRAQLLAFEQTFLATLNFNITMPSIEVFRVRYVKAALHGDIVLPEKDDQRQLNYLSAYYSQLSLQKVHFLRYLPSTIGAASVFLARQTLGMTPVWHGTLSHYTKYEAEEILPCARELAEAATLASKGTEQRATMKKFSHSRYLAVGTIPPPEPF